MIQHWGKKNFNKEFLNSDQTEIFTYFCKGCRCATPEGYYIASYNLSLHMSYDEGNILFG